MLEYRVVPCPNITQRVCKLCSARPLLFLQPDLVYLQVVYALLPSEYKLIIT
jgi:hypothetical protein